MPMATDVRLPKNVIPAFPDACCGCGVARPGHRVGVANRSFRWRELVWPWGWFWNKPVRVDVPVCAGCRPALMASRRWQILIPFAVAIALLPVVYPWAKSLSADRILARLIAMAACLVVLAPFLLWWVFHPPIFDTTVGADHVDYEFASAEYARQFAACNPTARVVA